MILPTRTLRGVQKKPAAVTAGKMPASTTLAGFFCVFCWLCGFLAHLAAHAFLQLAAQTGEIVCLAGVVFYIPYQFIFGFAVALPLAIRIAEIGAANR
jgi:hypothetical protein